MLFLFYTFFLILVIYLLIISTNIQIRVENLKYNESHINQEYQISIYLYILSKIPIFKLKLTQNKFEKLNQKKHIKEKIKEKMQKEKYDIDFKEIIKNIKIQINQLNFKIELGTENLILTSFLIPIISTILAIIVQKTRNKNNKQNFEVTPIYKNKNIINFQLEGIFKIKMIHIITTICILKKKRRVEKYERASNRRSYDYSYE